MKLINTVFFVFVGLLSVNLFFTQLRVDQLETQIYKVRNNVGQPDYNYEATTVKIGDDAHGSGVIVSSSLTESLIITNRHVCEGINPINEYKEVLEFLQYVHGFKPECTTFTCLLEVLDFRLAGQVNMVRLAYMLNDDINESLEHFKKLIIELSTVPMTYTVTQTQTELVMRGRVVRIDDDNDLCLMSVNVGNLTPVKFRSAPLVLGEPLINLGNPHDMVHHKVAGFVGKIIVYEGSEYFSNSGPIYPGNSGGGAYDKNGYLLGINTLSVPDIETFGFSIPFTVVLEFLNEKQK